jgi:hypothetical protein
VGGLVMALYESDLADDVYDILFKNSDNYTLNFVEAFPEAEVNREFAFIKLNDEFVITIERV